MIGRAISKPESGSACTNLDRATVDASGAISVFLRACGRAIVEGRRAPSLSAVDGRLKEQAYAITDLRRSGATRDLPGETVSRIFGLAFSFQQLHRNLQDLADRVDELAEGPATRSS